MFSEGCAGIAGHMTTLQHILRRAASARSLSAGRSKMMYKIMGRYEGSTEEIDTAATKHEAEYLLGEYALAFGPAWALWII